MKETPAPSHGLRRFVASHPVEPCAGGELEPGIEPPIRRPSAVGVWRSAGFGGRPRGGSGRAGAVAPNCWLPLAWPSRRCLSWSRLWKWEDGVVRKPGRARPKRSLIRLGRIDPTSLTARLRELHELGCDPELERFPDLGELYLVLQHAQRMTSGLKQPMDHPVNVMGEAAVLRAKLWQYLREQADVGQLRAIEAGRDAGVPWEHFTDALCVVSKQGAYQKARRLKAEEVRDDGERRSPEVARAHEDRAAAEERAERSRILTQERRFPLAQRVARQLLKNRAGLVVASWSKYWLEEISDTVDDRISAGERANFTGYVESFVRSVRQLAVERGGSPATTDGARQALELAVEFVSQELSPIPQQVVGSQFGNQSGSGARVRQQGGE